MKKVVVTMMAAFLVSSAFAQISKGAWLVGATSSLGLNSYSFGIISAPIGAVIGSSNKTYNINGQQEQFDLFVKKLYKK